MATDIVAAARGWIGTPYQHQASLKGAGCDCLGLLRGVWRELRGEEPEDTPPYAPDWADTGGGETLRDALARHLISIARETIAPGDVVLFRMTRGGPARHCGIVGEDSRGLTLIHARQSHRVMEELLSQFWTVRLAYAFRLNVGCSR